MTHSLPSEAITALCTCPIDAAPIGKGEMYEKMVEEGLPMARSIISIALSPSSPGTRSSRTLKAVR